MQWIRFALRRLYYFLKEDPIQGHIRRGLTVGENVAFMEEVKIDHSHCWHITIGDNVTLAPRVHILAHDASTKRALGYTRIAKVNIGSHVFVGAGSIILPGVTIGDNVIIGAGSVVSRSIPDDSVVAGNPAKVITSTSTYLEKKKKELSDVPVFEDQYTHEKGVTDEMKREMNDALGEGFGYVS